MENIRCTYRVSVKAIIKNEHDEIMLLKEDTGVWDLPGGGLDHGEQPHEALKRELDEETRLKAAWISDVPTHFWTVQRDTGTNPLKWFAFVGYGVKTSGTFRPTPGDETEGAIVEAKFVSVTDAAKLNLHENARAFVESLPKG